MKTMFYYPTRLPQTRFLFLAVAMLLLANTCGLAQRYVTNMHPDSVNVKFADLNATVVFEMRFIQEHMNYIEQFGTTLKEIQTQLQQSNVPLQSPLQISVTEKSNGEKQISIDRKTETARKIIVDQGVPREIGPMIELLINTRIAKVTVTVPNAEAFEQLKSYDFKKITGKLQEDMATQHMGRKRIEAGMVARSGEIEKFEVDYPSAKDFLIGYGSTGLGFVRDKIYVEANLSIATAFADHFNRPRHRFDFTYNNQFFTTATENGYRTDINSFLNLSWGVNLCYTCDRPRWTTLGVGYLVRERGGYYTGNTLKIFATTDIGNRKLNLVPELYLTDDLKKSMLGMKLTYAF